MKYIKSLLAIVLFVTFTNVTFAQKKEMTEEEWQAEINRLTEKKANLTTELNKLQAEVNNLKKTYASLPKVENCKKETLSLVGAKSRSDIDNFRAQLKELMAKIDRKVSPKADRMAELEALKSNKLAALPEFYNQIFGVLQNKLNAWKEKPKEVLYTVIRGDYLWKIAKMKKFYNNPFVWTKIYNANRDQIKDPDLIYPKQVFKIPKLTDEEKAQFDKILRRFKAAPPKQSK